MRIQVRNIAAVLAASLCTLLAACTTVYQPLGPTGGYRDTKLSDNRYFVEFSGNGNTSREAVWNYWIYRCADLTQQKGFAYFTVLPKAKTGAADDEASTLRMASDDSLNRDLVEMKGGGGGGGGFVYIPGGGGQITTWRSSATIVMFKSLDEPEAAYSLKASVVLESLKSFITTQGRERTIASEDLIRRAMAASIPASNSTSAVPWSGGAGGHVEMKDLGGLIPQ
ncbi:CC0125/CC1285 family lipoprotein [Variovorax sp. Sphag1AA]|uniref:CC0125/CC1285 family lipoprotein n=1 Tax=Variovorax sp. Sphag1AA TaxID=2587027 RepID=UPI00161A99C9|nr:hypothetical protein [Variovorax sp. Sphag1AA]MBB3181816.1 ABC-type cobalamin transport system ATPase subunit [Variovorax sp. Sphag1AA]